MSVEIKVSRHDIVDLLDICDPVLTTTDGTVEDGVVTLEVSSKVNNLNPIAIEKVQSELDNMIESQCVVEFVSLLNSYNTHCGVFESSSECMNDQAMFETMKSDLGGLIPRGTTNVKVDEFVKEHGSEIIDKMWDAYSDELSTRANKFFDM